MDKARTTDLTFAALAFIWLGVVAGVSFIATPARFGVESLPFPVAVEVGQATFALLSKIEWGFAGVLLITAAIGPARASKIGAALLALIVLTQSLWLLPVLSERAAAIVAGSPMPASAHHTIYAALEAVKILLLAIFGVLTLRRV